MTDAQLLDELHSAAATVPGYLRYDANYRPLVVREMCRRRGWTDADTQRILSQKIWIGATQGQVVASWGRPRSTSSHVTRNIDLDHWHYGDVLSSHTIVTFEAGLCTGWSEHR